MAVYVNEYEKLSILNAFINGLGGSIRVENSSMASDHIFGGIKLAPGYHTEVQLERSFSYMLPKPYSSCQITSAIDEFESNLFRHLKHSDLEYTRQLCLVSCYQKQLVDNCGCIDPFFVSIYDAAVCESNETMYECAKRESRVYFDNLEVTCLPQCPLECNYTQYKSKIAFFKLHGDLFYKHIIRNRNLTADFVTKPLNVATAAKSVVSFNVFYDSLSYTISTESPKMDLVSLLASIGGNMGLFMGISLLSLCEVVELLIELFLVCKNREN